MLDFVPFIFESARYEQSLINGFFSRLVAFSEMILIASLWNFLVFIIIELSFYCQVKITMNLIDQKHFFLAYFHDIVYIIEIREINRLRYLDTFFIFRVFMKKVVISFTEVLQDV